MAQAPAAAAARAAASAAAAAAEPAQQPQEQQPPPQHQQQPPQTNQQQQQQQTQQYNPPPQPPGVRRTFYRRVLPSPPATAFSSPEGRALFAQALAGGTMAGFFPLIEQYSTQDEPAFCGLSSLTMVLNALAIDPRRPWKGAWRWFHERLLDCCLPLSEVASRGVTLDQAACLARCNGALVELRRSGAFSLDEFREAVRDACSTGERHLVVSYSRAAFQQTGDGHFSPVGGYHEGGDLALILDTARFKYPPHWVPLETLYEAMAPLDKATGMPRGWLRLSAPAHPQDSVLFTLDVREHGRWRVAERSVLGGCSAAATAAVMEARGGSVATAEEAVRAVVAAVAATRAARGSVGDFVAVRLAARERAVDKSAAAPWHECGGGGPRGSAAEEQEAAKAAAPLVASQLEPCVPLGKRDQLLAELRHMPLFALVSAALEEQAQAAAGGDGGGCGDLHPHHHHDEPLREAAQVASPRGGDDGLLAEKLTVLMFLVDPATWPGREAWVGGAASGGREGADGKAAAAALREAARFASLLDVSAVSMVEAEVRYMREQLKYLPSVLGEVDSSAGCGAQGTAGGGGAAAAATATTTTAAAATDCGANCYTPLDCHVKGHKK
jgi:glutathione gamma-glutamylcysteinyltransferase